MKGNTEMKPYMGCVKLGPKGQIVIPKEVRDMFGISCGDTLVILAHPEQGVALERQQVLDDITNTLFSMRANDNLTAEEKERIELMDKSLNKIGRKTGGNE